MPGYDLEKYAGSIENISRLVLPLPEEFEEFELRTILPDTGTLHTTPKTLTPKKDRGVTTYATPRSLELTVPEEVRTAAENAPYIWPRPDYSGTWAAVQVWSIHFDDAYRMEFQITEDNPNEQVFDPQAVEEFKRTTKMLFGKAAESMPVSYCRRTVTNDTPVYIGTSDELLRYCILEVEVEVECESAR